MKRGDAGTARKAEGATRVSVDMSSKASLEIVVNGRRIASGAPTLAELLDEQGYGRTKVATAVNGSFVAERLRAATRLAADDEVEVVSVRQGG
jgi:sulfur carrier protein